MKTSLPWFLPVLFCLLVLGPPRFNFDLKHTDDWHADEAAENSSLESVQKVSFNNFLSIGAWGLAGLMLVVVLSSQTPVLTMHTKGPLLPYTLFAFAAIASLVYSPSPPYTLFFSSHFVLFSVLTCYIAWRGGWSTPLKFLGIAYGIKLSTITIALLINPYLVGASPAHVTSGYRLTGGVWTDYGGSGVVTVVFIYALLLGLPYKVRRWRSLLILAAAWALVYVVLSQTRQAMAATAMGLGTVTLLLNRRWSIGVLALGGISALACAWVLGLLDPVGEFLLRGQTMDQVKGMSERAHALEYVIERWKDSPWIGFGYAAGSREVMLQFMEDTGVALGDPHDSISRVLADTGLIGFFLLLTTMAMLIANLVKYLLQWNLMDDKSRFCTAVIIALIVPEMIRSISSQKAAIYNPLMTISIVTLVAMRYQLTIPIPRPDLDKPQNPIKPDPNSPAVNGSARFKTNLVTAEEGRPCSAITKLFS